MNLAVLASHPIQYQAPLFRAISRRTGVDLEVFFCHDHGVNGGSLDRGFGRPVQWDVPLLEGYKHFFLRNVSPTPSVSFWGQVNPSAARLRTKNRFDALLIHGYAAATNLLMIAAPARRSCPLLLRGESTCLEPRTRLRQAIKYPVLRALFSRIDHFVTIGSSNEAYYRSFGVSDQRMTRAPYTVDNSFFRARAENAGDQAAARRLLNLTETDTVFLFCAKLIAKKRPLDALHGFAAAGAPGTLVFAGSGALEGELREEVSRLGLSDRVRLLGFKNQTELPAVYRASDVLVLPSSAEPWGLVVNEAMASGLAVLVSDRVGAGADLVDGNGHIFRVGDVAALAALIKQLASDPARTAALKERSLALMKNWDIQQTVDGILTAVERSHA